MEYRQVQTIGGKGAAPEQFAESLRGITVDREDRLLAVGDSIVRVYESGGKPLREWRTDSPGHCVAAASNGHVFVGAEGQIEIFDADGNPIDTWGDAQRLGRVTAIGFWGADVLAADAADRCIRRFNERGGFLNDIGKDTPRKGFLIPNGVVDFAMDRDGLIRVSNPGMHRVQRFKPTGELEGHFGRFSGLDPAGFPGCCNPTNVAVGADDHVYVTEKAGPRVKVYDGEGTLLCVINDHSFDPNCKNMDIAVDSRGRVYVVDTVRLLILVFAPVEPPAKRESAKAPAEAGGRP